MIILVGKKLRQAREEQGFTLQQVAESTFIRLRFLEALEAGNFDVFPSPVQARGFLRAYTGFLKLDYSEILDLLEKDPISDALAQSKAELAGEDEDSEDEDLQDPIEQDTFPLPENNTDRSFISVGDKLRAQREILGISLDDIEDHIHVKKHYLVALEKGDFDEMPSMVQGSGMLKNYASFLGLDPEPLLLLFADSLQARLVARHPREEKVAKTTPPKKKIGGIRQFFSRDLLVGGFIIVFLVAFSVWAGMQISAVRQIETPVSTHPSIADVLLPSATSTPTPTVAPTVLSPLEVVTGEAGELAIPATQVPVDAVLLEGAVQVQIAVHQRTWVRILVDGEAAFDQRVIPGSVHAFAGEEQIEILTGNGAGLDLIYNGNHLGKMGSFGQVVHIVITRDGILNPTPTISPTATNTPLTTPTFSPTPQP